LHNLLEFINAQSAPHIHRHSDLDAKMQRHWLIVDWLIKQHSLVIHGLETCF